MKKKKEIGKSQMAKCDFCQNEFFSRGLKAHIRLKHKLELTQVKTEIISTKISPVNLSRDLSRDLSQKSPKAKLPQSHSEITQVPTSLLKSGGNPNLSKATQVKPITVTKVTEQTMTYEIKYAPDVQCKKCKEQMAYHQLAVVDGENLGICMDCYLGS